MAKHAFLQKGIDKFSAKATIVAALLLVLASLPWLPLVPHQHLINLRPVRLIVLVGFILVATVAWGIMRQRANSWWVGVGLMCSLISDPTPPIYPITWILPAVCLAALLFIGLQGNLRGLFNVVLGTGVAFATTIFCIGILILGGDDDLSFLRGLLFVVTMSLVTAIFGVRRSRLGVTGTALFVAVAQRAHGHAHITAFSTSRDKRAVKLPSGAVVSFRVSASVAITLGDPLGKEADRTQAVAEFTEFCDSHGLVPCLFQVRASMKEVYASYGFRLIKFGEEAIIQLPSFTLQTPKLANVRREVGRAVRAGLTAEVKHAREIDDITWADLVNVSKAWLGSRKEMGFSLGKLHELRERNPILVLVRDKNQSIVAFTSWHPIVDGLGLDIIRRRPDAAGGAMDLCVVTALQFGKEQGLLFASLGSIPTRDFAADIEVSKLARLYRRWAFRRGAVGYSYSTLSHFKEKFNPQWESRMIAVGSGVPGLVLSGISLALVHWSPFGLDSNRERGHVT